MHCCGPSSRVAQGLWRTSRSPRWPCRGGAVLGLRGVLWLVLACLACGRHARRNPLHLPKVSHICAQPKARAQTRERPHPLPPAYHGAPRRIRKPREEPPQLSPAPLGRTLVGEHQKARAPSLQVRISLFAVRLGHKATGSRGAPQHHVDPVASWQHGAPRLVALSPR